MSPLPGQRLRAAAARRLWPLLVCSLLVDVTPGRAADPDEAALREKTEEVERLKRELARAEAERRALEEENQRLRERAEKSTEPLPAPPIPPLTELPPLEDGTVVEAADLVRQFGEQPELAEWRYTGKTFQVRGVIAGFERAMMARHYALLLETPDPAVTPVCRFTYVDRYRTVYPQERGAVLVARIDDRATQVLHRRGETVVVRGRCGGVRDGELRFTGCLLARPGPSPQTAAGTSH